MPRATARSVRLVTRCTCALVLLSLALLTTTGCSSHSPRRPPSAVPVPTPPTATPAGGVPAPLAAAYDRTIARRTARIRFTSEVIIVSPSARRQDTVSSGTGTVDFVNSASDVVRDVTGGSGVEILIIGADVYRRTTPPGGAPDSTRWTRAVPAPATTGPPATAQPANSDDVALRLGYLSGASTPVTVVGQEAVDGVQTTRYKLSVNLETAAQRGNINATTVEYFKNFLGTVMQPTEAWIDAAGLVRQFRITLSGPASGGPASSSPTAGGTAPRTEITRTVTYSDFGLPLSITAPPASQVVPG